MYLTIFCAVIGAAAAYVSPKYSYTRGINFAAMMFNGFILIDKIGNVA